MKSYSVLMMTETTERRQMKARVTHKLLCAGEVKQFDQSKVVASGNVQAGVRHTCTVDFSFVSVSGPNPQNFISQDAEKKKREEELNDVRARFALLIPH